MHQPSPQAHPSTAKHPARSSAAGQRGSILFYLIAGMVAFGVLAMAGATRFSSVVSSVLAPNCATSARYMAESGLRYAMARLRACTTESCVSQAVDTMKPKVVIVDAARGLKFTLQANYDSTTRAATVTSTGNGCTSVTASSKAMTTTLNLPTLDGGGGDIDFSNLGEDFTITAATGTNKKIPITVDADGKLVFLGVINDTYNSAAIWYNGNNTYCTDGNCTMTYGLRAYFEAQWDLSSIADGIVFAVKSALTNVMLSAGGDPYKSMGEVMGWAGPGPKALGVKGISAPKIGLELDTWRNNANSDVTSADSRAERNYVDNDSENRNSDHMAFVFWGGEDYKHISSGWLGFDTPTYDDNRHATSFTDSVAGTDNSTQPRSYQDLDGTGDGRWGYYYRKAASTWLRDGTKHLIRFELWRIPSYPNAQGNYPYLLKAWVRSASPGSGYADVTADYTTSPPDLYRAIFLSNAMHKNLAKIILGFTEATGEKTHRVTVSGLKVSFRKTEGIPAMPTDHVAYFPMTEGSGSTVSDSHGINATRYGDASWNKPSGCTRCPAIEFNDKGVLHADGSPTVAPGASGTIATWYYMPDKGTSDDGLVHKGDRTDNADESYSLQLTGSKRLGLVIRQANNQSVKVDTSITPDYVWHHVAATWTPTELLIYIDGELKGRTANTNAYAARASTGGLNIGAQGFNASASNEDKALDGFTGRLFRVAIFNRALTPLEIAAMAVAP